ncbi:MAG: hypothetical protein FJW39_21100 [Acidobacteria bacterium]|nr:hypothetical protein [Acidobacteriota bacterium]
MRYGSANVTTFVVLMLVLWQVIARFKCEDTSNWPLVFYVFLWGYHQTYPGTFNLTVVLAATITALLIRYEFLGKKARGLLVTLEMAGLAYFGQALASSLFW